MVSFFRCARKSLVAAILIGVTLLAGWGCSGEDEGPANAGLDSPAPKSQTTEGPQDLKVEPPMPPPEPTEAKKQSDVELPKEAELRDRVQARWDALIKGDLGKAYGFETPEYRKAYTVQDYNATIGRQVRWHVAMLKELRYDRPDEVEAIVTLDYSFPLPGSDQMPRTTGDISERWVYSDGQWWRRQDLRSPGGKRQSQPSLPQ